MDLRDFPFDEQLCSIKIGSCKLLHLPDAYKNALYSIIPDAFTTDDLFYYRRPRINGTNVSITMYKNLQLPPNYSLLTAHLSLSAGYFAT